MTNRPLSSRTSFDRTRFEGDLPAGWEAEIYRNGELLGFAKPDGSQRYVFDDAQLLYGENRIEIRLYGPQGQVRSREELVNVGQDNVPKGKTWYWAGLNQPARDIVALEKPPDSGALPKAQTAVSLEHGLDDRTSVGILARAMLIGDQRLTFVEGTVRRSIGPALVELGGARESDGGNAAHARIVGKFGGVNVSAEALLANDFHLQGGVAQSVRQGRVALDAPIRLGKAMLPAHLEANYLDRADGTHQLDAAARLSANFDRFNLSTDLKYRKDYDKFGAGPPGQFGVALIGSGRIGSVRLRGTGEFDLSPKSRLRTAELSAYWNATEHTDWEGALGYDGEAHRARARLTHVIRLDTMALAFTGEAASDGGIAFGMNLNFSLDPRHGLTLSRRPLAEAGIVHATVYRDLNDNGVRDAGEPFEKGALVTTGTQQAERPTDAHGSVTIGGMTAYMPVTVGVDVTSLADPMLVPKKALQVVVPRPGIPADVQIALVGGGDIEGALIKSAELGFEGVDLELVDASGKVAGTARTDFDGFFLFERVPYGSYTIRVNGDSARAAKIAAELGVHFEVGSDKSVIRLGAIRPTPEAHMAAAGGEPAGTP